MNLFRTSINYLFIHQLHRCQKSRYREIRRKMDPAWQNIVTNGAYTLKRLGRNERIVFERSPTYWNNAKTVINQVTYLPIASEVTDVNRYRSGEIDMTYNNMPIELFQKLKKEIPTKSLIHTCALTITKLTTRNRHLPCVCVPHWNWVWTVIFQ